MADKVAARSLRQSAGAARQARGETSLRQRLTPAGPAPRPAARGFDAADEGGMSDHEVVDLHGTDHRKPSSGE